MGITERLELWLPIMFFTILWVVMQWYGKLPSVDSVQKFVAVVNSRGGNIVILCVAGLYFFKYSMYLFMDLLSMVRNKTISEDNAFALMAIQFVTTSAFGGAMGALLKTMTGESSSARKGDIPTNKDNDNDTTSPAPVLPVTNTSSTVDTTPPTTPV